jgi:hypothetical protein
VPVSQSLNPALSWAITQGIERGWYSSAERAAKLVYLAPSTCKDTGKLDFKNVTLGNFFGPLLITGFCSLLALILSFWQQSQQVLESSGGTFANTVRAGKVQLKTSASLSSLKIKKLASRDAIRWVTKTHPGEPTAELPEAPADIHSASTVALVPIEKPPSRVTLVPIEKPPPQAPTTQATDTTHAPRERRSSSTIISPTNLSKKTYDL